MPADPSHRRGAPDPPAAWRWSRFLAWWRSRALVAFLSRARVRAHVVPIVPGPRRAELRRAPMGLASRLRSRGRAENLRRWTGPKKKKRGGASLVPLALDAREPGKIRSIWSIRRGVGRGVVVAPMASRPRDPRGREPRVTGGATGGGPGAGARGRGAEKGRPGWAWGCQVAPGASAPITRARRAIARDSPLLVRRSSLVAFCFARKERRGR